MRSTISGGEGQWRSPMTNASRTRFDSAAVGGSRLNIKANGCSSATESPMRIVKRQAPATEPNYHGLDKPTVQRKRAVGDGLEEGGLQEELLDIPAFLRRQAD